MAYTPTELRLGIIACAMFGYYNRRSIGYASPGAAESSQRSQDFKPPPNVPFNTDCSAFATWCYKCAGAKDPSGFNYRSIGSTYSQIKRGKRLSSKGQLKAGDLVFYGGNSSAPTHVAIYVGEGKVVSHGSEPGPLLLSTDYRSDRVAMRSYI